MKILVYSLNYYPELTGVGKYTGEMARWLAVLGHDVRVVSAPPYYPDWKVSKGFSASMYRKDTCIVERSSSASKNTGTLVVYRCPLWIPRRLSGLTRLLHLGSFAITSLPVMLGHVFWRPDWVWVVEPPLFCAPGALLSSRLCGAKAWLHVQDFEVDAAFDLGMLDGRFLRRIVLAAERWLLRRFDRVSTISERMLVRLDSKGLATEKRVLFPNWVDTDQIFPMDDLSSESSRGHGLRQELGLSDDAVVALYSGNMGQKQGLEIVIEAARRLGTSESIYFVMCGQGAAFERLHTMAEGLKNVMWLPLQPVERLNELLNLADIHLLPQRADAADLVMPSKLTGMLSSGRPVVATAAEGTEVWSVVEGRGINTPPGDVSAFAEAIKVLADDKAQRSVLGEAGRLYAVEHLNRDAVLGRFEEELMRVVGR
jgi:colanic acid biosynthesis glycosyl transferase WcaI